MARDWSAAFDAWGRPPSKAEEAERRRTEEEIDVALREHRPLQEKRIKIYAKGSYRRGTNVRRGSDIDIAVELRGDQATGESFRFEKAFQAADLSNEELGIRIVDFSYTVAELKQDVHDALVRAFGERAATWSNKCIKIREKATTLPADVVPCRTHRRYDSRSAAHDGIEIHPDKGGVIINWPQQDEDNGTAKNTRTNLRFKRAVRGIKSLENEMVDRGVIEIVPSCMMECAIYNVPDRGFGSPDNYTNCLSVLGVMAEAAADPAIYNDWEEVNGLKYLFRPSQAWTIEDVRRLVKHSIAYLREG
jgi:predicted nucleotidyltransferase